MRSLFSGQGRGARAFRLGFILVVLIGGSSAWAGSRTEEVATTAQAPPGPAGTTPSENPTVEWAENAKKAQSSPVSFVLYEVQDRHFGQKDCEPVDGDRHGINIIGDDDDDGGNFREEECEPVLESARAHCPGNLKVIGGGGELTDRQEATIIDSYPLGSADQGWVVHIQRIPDTREEENGKLRVAPDPNQLLVRDGEEQFFPETEVRVYAICAEVVHTENRGDL
jgi:hypothetical protein